MEVDEGGSAEATKPTNEANGEDVLNDASASATSSGSPQASGYSPYRFTLLEALSATGLRSIRYAKEIPLIRYVCHSLGTKTSDPTFLSHS